MNRTYSSMQSKHMQSQQSFSFIGNHRLEWSGSIFQQYCQFDTLVAISCLQEAKAWIDNQLLWPNWNNQLYCQFDTLVATSCLLPGNQSSYWYWLIVGYVRCNQLLAYFKSKLALILDGPVMIWPAVIARMYLSAVLSVRYINYHQLLAVVRWCSSKLFSDKMLCSKKSIWFSF